MLTGALEDDFRSSSAFSADCRTSTVSRLGGLCRFACSSSWVICLASGAVAAYAPKLRLKANRKVLYQAHGITLLLKKLTLSLVYRVNQRAGAVFGADLFFPVTARVQRRRSLPLLSPAVGRSWSRTGFAACRPASLAKGKQVDHGGAQFGSGPSHGLSARRWSLRCRQRGQVQRLIMPSRGGVTVPDHTVSMLPTIVAPTRICAIGPNSVSKQADDALVTGEQVRHVLRRQVVNREQVASGT